MIKKNRESKKKASVIYKKNDKQLGLIRDFLDLEREDEKAQEQRPSCTCISKLVSQALSTVQL